MTTIAFDGRYLASDSRLSAGNMICPSIQKIFERTVEDEKVVLAFSGDTDQAFYILQSEIWDVRKIENIDKINNKFKTKDDKLTVNFFLFPVNKDKTKDILFYHFVNNETAVFAFKGQYAMGSGQEFALGALKCDRNAIFAVKVASELDVYTDDKIQFYDFENEKLDISCLK